MIPFEEWVPEEDSIAFPFQEETERNTATTVEDTNAQEKDDPIQVDEAADKYTWENPSEAPSETAREAHKRLMTSDRRKQKRQEEQEASIRRPYNLSREEAKSARQARDVARAQKFAAIMTLSILTLDSDAQQKCDDC